MKKYLSMGMGVNSVAAYFICDFDEAVFVDTGCEWPETYEYLKMFRKKYPVTVLKPDVEGFDNLYDFCMSKKIIPSKMFRWCTDKFKVKTMQKYFDTPCFSLINFATDEAHRAKISTVRGIENRFPLIEHNADRLMCKQIIAQQGLPIPIKSGCYICPYQKPIQVKSMRMNYSDLFCKAERLEDNCKNSNIYLFGSGAGQPIRSITDENQSKLWKEDEYPPCECML